MLPNMKFYVVSIVAIFTALGIGIYIGFSIDTQEFVTDQQENLVDIVESQFETITENNKELVLENEELVKENSMKNDYITESYNYIIPEKLNNKNIAIIESNNEYVTSGIGNDLERAGAEVSSLTTIENLSRDETKKLTESIILASEEGMDLINEYVEAGKIDFLGELNENLDLIIICGGSCSEETSKVIDVDRTIIDVSKEKDLPVIGVEKSTVKNSFINKYKEYGVSTIDNVDMMMGKVALILSINGRDGNFGIKGTSETVLPSY